MNKLVTLIVLLVIALGVLAYYQGWLNFGKDPQGNFKVTFDKAKFEKDKEAARKYFADQKRAAADKLADLRKQQKEGKDADKAKLDKEIKELSKTIDDLEKSDKELDEQDESKLEALHKKITEMLEKAKKE